MVQNIFSLIHNERPYKRLDILLNNYITLPLHPNKTWDEFWGEFDEDDYAASIKNLQEHELRQQHGLIRKKVVASRTATGVGAAGAFHTFGASLLGAGAGYRRQKYNSQKQNIIEERMYQKGWRVPEMSTGDFLMAVGPTAVASVALPGAEHVAGHFISHAAGHGAAAFTSNHVADTISALGHHPVDFLHAVEGGVSAQTHALSQGLAGHATQLVPIDAVATNTTSFFGDVAGQAAANALEMELINKTVEKSTKWGVRALLAPVAAASISASQSAGSRNGAGKYSSQSHSQFKTATSTVRGISKTNIPVESNIAPFIFILLPSIINATLGLPALLLATLTVIIWDLFTSDRTNLFSLWIYLSIPSLTASALGKDALWIETFGFELMMAVQARKINIPSPGVLACVDLPLLCGASGSLRATCFGFFLAAASIALIQHKNRFVPWGKDSLVSMSWRCWKRPEYVTLVIPALSYCSDPALLPFWSGCFFAGFLICFIQMNARRYYH